MTDYTKNNDYSAKDALPPDDPDKLVLGTELDSEFDEIATAISSKYDSSDIATQAQAQAGTNNTTLMTPLRVSELLGTSGGGGGSANALTWLIALNDPGDNQILFWDDTANEITWLDLGAGLSYSAGVISVDGTVLDHNLLVNYDSNEHIDHTSISPTAGEGLAFTGTDLTATFSYSLDIDSLTVDASPDATADYIAIYDNSAAGHKKVQVDALVGTPLGEAKYYRNSDITITSTLTAVPFNTAEADNLQRGTFNTSNGRYTSTSGGTALVTALATYEAQPQGDDAEIHIVKNGTVEEARQLVTNRGRYGASTSTALVTTVVDMAAADYVDIRVKNATTITGTSGRGRLYVSIVELR